MKKFLFTTFILLFTVANSAFGYHVIKVRRTGLKEKPHAFSKVITELKFSTRVRIIKQKGPYYYISTRQGKGYVFRTAIDDHKSFKKHYAQIDTSKGYSSDSLTAATKGFSKAETDYNKEVRLRYDLVNKALNFSKNHKIVKDWKGFRSAGKIGEYRILINSKYYKYFKRNK